MPSISSASLAVAILVAGYLSALCTTPPNPNPDKSKRYKSDRAGILSGTFPWVVKHVQIVVFAYHALVTLLYPAENNAQLDSICPHTENLPPALFTWNERMYKVLFVIFLGAFIRLSAYGGLGRNFTFHLSNPDHLVTDGVYKYLQHPSYTGAALVTFGMAGLLTRWDTAAGACWMQPSTLAMLNGYGWLFTAAWGIFLFSVLGVRVRDEETMLREQFGKEWEKWHARTKRANPRLAHILGTQQPLSLSPPRRRFLRTKSDLDRTTAHSEWIEVMDNVDPSGPSAEFVNVHRRRLITKILKAIRRDEESEGHGRGKYKFPSATWFSLWLSDMDRLEEIATAFDQNPERASGLYTMTESFRLVTLWVPHSGITPKLPTIRPPSRPTSAVATPTTPSTPTINRATQLTLRTVGTPVESSPAKLSSLNQPSPTDPSPTAVQPSRKRQRIDSPANSNTASDRDRDPIFTRNCLDRDWVCGITKSTDPLQAAHICAVSLNKHKRDYTQKYIHFKSSLAVFWSDAQVRKWSDRMKTLAKSTANALALQSSAHDYWDRALFALQPISVNDQKTEMKLRFYWLKPGSLLPQGSTLLLPEDVTPNFLVDPPILADNRETGGRDHHENVSEALLALFNCQTQQIIRSGDDIIITTPDPIRFPLPDEELLRLQWILHRLAALCAAAGFHADSFFEDDDSFAGAACMVTPPGVYESVDEQDCLSKRLWEAFLCKPPQVDQSRV